MAELATTEHEGPARVLVVDDDATIRHVVAEMLADEGFATRLATHGREALDALEEFQPDLIVLDLMMPIMDGWAFRAAQRARGDYASIPVLILSAARDLPDRIAQLDAAAVMSKPFDLITLLDTVSRLVHRPAS